MRRVDYNIGMVRDDDGESRLVQIRMDGLRICNTIVRKELREHPFINGICADWDNDRVLLFLRKSIAGMFVSGGVINECKRIALTDWVVKTQLHPRPAQGALLIRRNKWFSYLKEYAQTYPIRLFGYRGGIGTAFSEGYPLILRAMRRLVRVAGKSKEKIRQKAAGKAASTKGPDRAPIPSPSGPTLAVKYMGGRFSLDPGKRSELFWVNGSGIPGREILFYNVFSDASIDSETLSQLKEQGIRLYGTGQGMTEWESTATLYTVLLRKICHIAVAYLRCLLFGHWVSLYYVRQFVGLARDYAYWYDFYDSNHVMIDVSAIKMTAGQVLALEAIKGISVAYQYSISNFYPLVGLNAGEDIQFLISRSFERLWHELEAPVGTFVETGYIYDGIFNTLGTSDTAFKVGKQFEENKVAFRMCFFDESSNNRWDVSGTHEKAAGNYEFLLKWLMDDASLGMVFKPKRSREVFQRIVSISTLIQEARKTGRCIFLLDDTDLGSTYPAEAATMADLCIGMLTGTTAAFEAQLAGVPAVLIDVDGYYSHPFYAWGRGTTVFDSWESLRNAVERYRIDPESYSKFGDWTPGLDGLDPYRDGQAGVRMGSYIHWVYKELKRGMKKENAIKIATDRYSQKWSTPYGN